jgi:hypothetical protein
MSREKLTRAFLWVSVLGFGIALGGKLFDLLILARAWSAAPPASLALLPYGPRWPMNPGDFFQPLGVPTLVGILGALLSGWKTPFKYRIWLWIPMIIFLIIWPFTIFVFWPMIRELYHAASGSMVMSDTDLIAVTRRWVTYDWVRVAMIAACFVSAIRAISIPFPRNER